MEYNDQARLDPTQMGSGGGGRGKVALGGGAGLIVVILALIFGFNPNVLMGGGGAEPQGSGTNPYAHCTSGEQIESDRECRWVAYTNSVQSYWKGVLNGYQQTRTTIFTGQIATGCGVADSSVGPFYCPADKVIYLDTGFFDALTRQLGAKGGDAAEAYLIAHEYGHHIQNLTGVMAKVQSSRDQTGPTSAQVRMELQADCYAGSWLQNATDDPNSPIKTVTQEDLNLALNAALTVGDDRIQERSSGRVDRESWTHGSSEQRQRWLLVGFKSGDPTSCDTFSTNKL